MIRGNMTDQKKALGKGLGSLIPMTAKQSSGEHKEYILCPLSDIVPNPNQPRKLFSKESLSELAASIEEKGVIQPVLLREIGGGKYEIVAGERRYRACLQIGLERVPAIVKEANANEVLELALIENIQRQDLNPVEEALAYKDLLSRHQYTQEELAKQIGKDRSSIANSLRLLKLPDKVRDYLIGNVISMGHARALLSFDSKELQVQVANDIVSHNLSVRDVELLTKKYRAQESLEVKKETKETIESIEQNKNFQSLIKNLETHLRRKVVIKSKGNAGQLVVTFSNENDLNSLIAKLMS
jgi:ParB family transcriptional regulator, chromosome partitioning protein